MNLNPHARGLLLSLPVAFLLTGCNGTPTTKETATDGLSVAERVKRIQSNPTLTDAEKATWIKKVQSETKS